MPLGSHLTPATSEPPRKRHKPMIGGGPLGAPAQLGLASTDDQLMEFSSRHESQVLPDTPASATLAEDDLSLARLPQDILSDVLGCLQVQERLLFRCVCRDWKSAPPATRAPLPWLLTHAPSPSEAKHRSDAKSLVMSFYSPWENKMYEIAGLVGAEGCREVVGSSPDGTWLMYVDGQEELHGVHVPSGERVKAPPLATVTGASYASSEAPRRNWSRFCRAIVFCPSFSSSYSSSASSRMPKFTIVAVCRDHPRRRRSNRAEALVFARDGDDSWTDIDPRGITSLRHMMLHDGSLYIANGRGDVLRVDGLVGAGGGANPKSIALPSWNPRVPPCRVEIADETTITTIPALPRMAYLKPTTFVAGFHADVYQVWGSPFRAVFTSSTTGVGFARLDPSGNKWDDEVREVGSYAAFLGNGHPLVYSTKEFRQLASGRVRLDDGLDFIPPMMFGKLHEPAWGVRDRPQPTWVVPDLR